MVGLLDVSPHCCLRHSLQMLVNNAEIVKRTFFSTAHLRIAYRDMIINNSKYIGRLMNEFPSPLPFSELVRCQYRVRS